MMVRLAADVGRSRIGTGMLMSPSATAFLLAITTAMTHIIMLLYAALICTKMSI
jgi:hypothetical protein